MRWFWDIADIDPQENLEDFVACSGCNETGYVVVFSAETGGPDHGTYCPKCGGSGMVHVNEQYNWERSRRPLWYETKSAYISYLESQEFMRSATGSCKGIVGYQDVAYYLPTYCFPTLQSDICGDNDGTTLQE